MKVIFLDVDGVLNTHDSPGRFPINRNRLRQLERIVKVTGAVIVLSSTWRKLDYTFERLNKKLKYRGMMIHSRTTTDYFKERQVRGDEIQLWLDEHPEVTNYVILDDDSDMLKSQLNNFVHTNGYSEGLTEEKADEAISILMRN